VARGKKQNVTPPALETRHKEAARLLAEGELTDAEVATRFKLSRVQLWRWKRMPEFAALVREITDSLGELALRYAIGRRARRFAAYQRRWEALETIARDRGYLVTTVKGIGGGDNWREVEEVAFDAALARELRELEKQAATEAGQWVEKVAPTSPDGNDPYQPFSEDERNALVSSVMARLGVARPGPNGAGPGTPH
jgi:hypothetical protein